MAFLHAREQGTRVDQLRIALDNVQENCQGLKSFRHVFAVEMD